MECRNTKQHSVKGSRPGRGQRPSGFTELRHIVINLCTFPASLGIKVGYTLDGVPTHRRAHTTDNLEMPINLQYMSLDRGRKPEYPEETPEARGEHTNSTHTHGGGGNRTPNPGGVRQTC
ncbi:hypothetical protein QTP70_029697 [Hemibagrus guttatus]|uniref:Uncharacterized protein n=1 Tax=Hemibagrus guttatus TaxID=175788 RepID=A0AAE0V5Z5_9TELE|nr:hypothetical protein QTP70_029697 [Hemibagrus guttatus]